MQITNSDTDHEMPVYCDCGNLLFSLRAKVAFFSGNIECGRCHKQHDVSILIERMTSATHNTSVNP